MKTLTTLLVLLFLGNAGIYAQPSVYNTNEETTIELSTSTDGNELLNVRYFYYPNLQAYFDRQTSTYLYTRNGVDWIESANLPNGLRGYSMSNGKRVPITDYQGDEPYELLKEHKAKYPAKYSTKRDKKEKTTENSLALN